MMIRLGVGIAMSALLVGCAAQPKAPPPATSASAGSQVSAERMCRDAFPRATVLGWRDANVADLRAYQYGGPVAHFPLRTAFVGVSPARRGAWCWLGEGPDSGSLWGVVPGSASQRAIGITGTGEGRFRGQMNVPLVP